MKIFDFNIRKKGARKKVAIPTFVGNRQNLCFSRSEILDCQKKITDRLANAVFSAQVDFIETRQIFDFVNTNRLQIVQRIFSDGFVIIDCEQRAFVNTSNKQITKDVSGNVVFELLDTEVVIVSETYRATGRSDRAFLLDKIKYLDTINSSDFNLIENYGAMGIVSPESDNSMAGAEFTDEDIDELQKSYQQHYGVKFGKWSLMFVPRPTKFNPISLPIASLQLSEKRRYILQALYESFGIPKELSTYFGEATYANRSAAELDFYNGTITKWANVMVSIVRAMYDNVRLRKSYLLPNEFWFDFVGVLALQDAQHKQKEAARIEFDFWMKVKQSTPEHSDTADNRIKSIIENL